MTHLKQLLALACLFAVVLTSDRPSAQHPSVLTADDKASFIDAASRLLNANYVFPDVAGQIEAHLKSRLREGAFDKVSTLQDFAALLTTEMQAVSRDQHMRCRSTARGPGVAAPARPDVVIAGLKEERTFGFARAGHLDANVGYLELFNFPSLERAKAPVDEAMKHLAGSKALIIDLRRNGGGSPDSIRYICSYLFDKPTHINSIYWRSSNTTIDFVTADRVDGPKMGGVPIFVLTSHYTFSGGEEFAYDIQTQRRGLLIGETTGGGANPGGSFPIGDELRLFIPTGRAINPITKTNWEGVGVVPDVGVDATNAFEIALARARQAATGGPSPGRK